MTMLVRTIMPVVLQQHAEEAAMLRHIRTVLVAAPHVKLHQLRRLDDRLAAHLDGLAVAGEQGTRPAWEALERPGCGEVFTVTARALQARDVARLDRVLSLAAAVAQGPAGVISAFGWVSGALLGGITLPLLDSPQAFRRRVGLAACA